MAQKEYIPYLEIAKGLGIQKGDAVLLTSDVLKLAMKARKRERSFDPHRFLRSFIEEVGEEGTLLVPAYNFDLEDGDTFDVGGTMPMTGALALAAMNDKSFERTRHPLHSFLVSGKDRSLLAGMNNKSSFGPDSPFAYLHQENALMVFAGTSPSEAMTFVHYVEESEQVKYRKYRELIILCRGRDGSSEKRAYGIFAKKPGYTMRLERLPELFPPGVLKSYSFNEIPFFTIGCRDAFDALQANIRADGGTSLAGFSMKLYFRDIIKTMLSRFNLFRTTYGKIRSAKRTY